MKSSLAPLFLSLLALSPGMERTLRPLNRAPKQKKEQMPLTDEELETLSHLHGKTKKAFIQKMKEKYLK